jgi:CheY-like chemotaxis protein
MEMSQPRRHGRESAADGLSPAAAGVLIVVDDRLVGRHLARMLTEMGYEGVRAVSRAGRALILAHEHEPGIIFVDLELPEDAYALARALQRQAGRDLLRLIALTPAIEHSTREQARRAGFERWLITPVAQDELEHLLLTARDTAA